MHNFCDVAIWWCAEDLHASIAIKGRARQLARGIATTSAPIAMDT
jgi:hypothetical protein